MYLTEKDFIRIVLGLQTVQFPSTFCKKVENYQVTNKPISKSKMTPVSSDCLADLHEEHLRYITLSSISEKLLCDLLGHFLVNQDINVNGQTTKLSGDREVALSELFRHHPEYLEDVKTIKLPHVQQIFFTSHDANGNGGKKKKELRGKINFFHIDISIAAALLLHVGFFPTSDKDNALYRSLTVINNMRKLVSHNLREGFWTELKNGTQQLPHFPENMTFDQLFSFCRANILDVACFLVKEKFYVNVDLNSITGKIQKAEEYSKQDFVNFNSHLILKQWTIWQQNEFVERLNIRFYVDETEIKPREVDRGYARLFCFFHCGTPKPAKFKNAHIKLNSELSKPILNILEEQFKEVTENDISNETFEVVLDKCDWAIGQQNLSANSIVFECYVNGEFDKGCDILKGTSQQSEDLQLVLEKLITSKINQTLGVKATVRFNKWKAGSLKIQGTISKDNELEWGTSEKDELLKMVKEIVKEKLEEDDVEIRRVIEHLTYPGRAEFVFTIHVHSMAVLSKVLEFLLGPEGDIKSRVLECLISTPTGFDVVKDNRNPTVAIDCTSADPGRDHKPDTVSEYSTSSGRVIAPDHVEASELSTSSDHVELLENDGVVDTTPLVKVSALFPKWKSK